jgi:DNA-binding IclR family transcriptional regulator
MRTFATYYVRQLLRINPEGMDVGTIANTLDREPSNIRRLLSTMPDAYIDRWVRKNGNPPMAIWCVVVPPENCPKPENKRRKK